MAFQGATALFVQFVRSLERAERLTLLGESHSSLFLFRLLPPLAQHCILAGIWNEQVGNESLHLKEGTSNSDETTQLLFDLDLLVEEDGTIKVQPCFRRSYLRAVVQGAHRCARLVPANSERKKKREKDQEKKASERWECILRYLALPSGENTAAVSERTRQVFRAANFSSGADNDMEITSAGFQFLLLAPVQQVWTYVIEWLRLEMKEGRSLREILDVLLRIALCADGNVDSDKRAFGVDENWNEQQMEFLMHLRELGLIFMRKRKDGVFFLTSLLSQLAAGSDSNAPSASASLAATASATATRAAAATGMIVETNYRVYSYTSSSLTLAILSTFCSINYRFHDMSVGVLTRDSVRQALQVGITADQIIAFLRANVHPAATTREHIVPITVSDQIRLWEDERKRLAFTDATLYSNFESEKEYQDVHAFATDRSILLFADNTRKIIIVSGEGHEVVKAWWKSRTDQQRSSAHPSTH